MWNCLVSCRRVSLWMCRVAGQMRGESRPENKGIFGAVTVSAAFLFPVTKSYICHFFFCPEKADSLQLLCSFSTCQDTDNVFRHAIFLVSKPKDESNIHSNPLPANLYKLFWWIYTHPLFIHSSLVCRNPLSWKQSKHCILLGHSYRLKRRLT